jgi:hypothetical protein
MPYFLIKKTEDFSLRIECEFSLKKLDSNSKQVNFLLLSWYNFPTVVPVNQLYRFPPIFAF